MELHRLQVILHDLQRLQFILQELQRLQVILQDLPSYSLGSLKNAECSNCKLSLGIIKVLEATVEMYMHPEQHALNSTAPLHEVFNDMGKLGLE
ncbi:hypothetical protein Tco_0140841 [Tanacetum coccineum]